MPFYDFNTNRNITREKQKKDGQNISIDSLSFWLQKDFDDPPTVLEYSFTLKKINNVLEISQNQNEINLQTRPMVIYFLYIT